MNFPGLKRYLPLLTFLIAVFSLNITFYANNAHAQRYAAPSETSPTPERNHYKRAPSQTSGHTTGASAPSSSHPTYVERNEQRRATAYEPETGFFMALGVDGLYAQKFRKDFCLEGWGVDECNFKHSFAFGFGFTFDLGYRINPAFSIALNLRVAALYPSTLKKRPQPVDGKLKKHYQIHDVESMGANLIFKTYPFNISSTIDPSPFSLIFVEAGIGYQKVFYGNKTEYGVKTSNEIRGLTSFGFDIPFTTRLAFEVKFGLSFLFPPENMLLTNLSLVGRYTF